MANFFEDHNIDKSPKIKAIETHYKGYRMRSRLEARWAVFFDALKIKWMYEPEGFVFNGEMYLPDFYLPEFAGGCFVEVKFKATQKEIEVCKNLVELTRNTFMICEGAPSGKTIKYIVPGEDWVWDGWPKYHKAYDEDRMWVCPCPEELDEIDLQYSEYGNAVKAARAARFEHNEFKK